MLLKCKYFLPGSITLWEVTEEEDADIFLVLGMSGI
jgi:hypothetical protein